MQVQVFWQDQLGNGFSADYADRTEAENRLATIEREQANTREAAPTHYGLTDWHLDCEAEALRLALGVPCQNSFFRDIACRLRGSRPVQAATSATPLNHMAKKLQCQLGCADVHFIDPRALRAVRAKLREGAVTLEDLFDIRDRNQCTMADVEAALEYLRKEGQAR